MKWVLGGNIKRLEWIGNYMQQEIMSVCNPERKEIKRVNRGKNECVLRK